MTSLSDTTLQARQPASGIPSSGDEFNPVPKNRRFKHFDWALDNVEHSASVCPSMTCKQFRDWMIEHYGVAPNRVAIIKAY